MKDDKKDWVNINIHDYIAEHNIPAPKLECPEDADLPIAKKIKKAGGKVYPNIESLIVDIERGEF